MNNVFEISLDEGRKNYVTAERTYGADLYGSFVIISELFKLGLILCD